MVSHLELEAKKESRRNQETKFKKKRKRCVTLSVNEVIYAGKNSTSLRFILVEKHRRFSQIVNMQPWGIISLAYLLFWPHDLCYSPSRAVDLWTLWLSHFSEQSASSETKLKVLVFDCTTFHKGFWVKGSDPSGLHVSGGWVVSLYVCVCVQAVCVFLTLSYETADEALSLFLVAQGWLGGDINS